MPPLLRRRLSLQHRLSLIASAATLFLAAATSALSGPFVNAYNTPIAITGGTVVITGGNFDATPANNTVQFNDGAAGTVTAATTSSLSVTLTTPPASTGALTAVVTTDGQSSGAPVQVAVVQPVVQVSAASGIVIATDGSFSIPVTVTGSAWAVASAGRISTTPARAPGAPSPSPFPTTAVRSTSRSPRSSTASGSLINTCIRPPFRSNGS